jgi:beta-glucosidase
VYGVSDVAVADVLAGKHPATGRLPFELPKTMDSVLAHDCDVAGGLAGPLFPLFYAAEG